MAGEAMGLIALFKLGRGVSLRVHRSDVLTLRVQPVITNERNPIYPI